MAADDTHARFIERLGDSHEKRVIESLYALEDRLVQLVAEAPLRDGKLFDLEWAVQARKDIRALIDDEFLSTVNDNVDSFNDAVKSAEAMIGKYAEFTGVSKTVVRALKKQSFQGFEELAGTFLNDIAGEVYQNTLTGRPVADSIKTLRQKINGVYAQADKVEIQKLVDIAAAGGAGAEDAIKKLHSVYAADKLGNNMRRYATQMVHDSLMQFDASINVQAGIETGADKWKYYGSVIRDSREFCAAHAGKVYTEEEIREIWQGNWAGKAPGDPFIVRGGYNCRHHFRPYYSEEEDVQPVEQEPQRETYRMPDEVKTSGFGARKSVFEAEMNKLSDEQLKVVKNLPAISEWVVEKNNGLYYSQSRKLVANPDMRSGSVVRHEYGHHIDSMLGQKYGASTGWFSSSDKDFLNAFDADRKANGLHRTATFDEGVKKIREFLYTKQIQKRTIKGKEYDVAVNVLNDDEYGNFSDILDALTRGNMQKIYGGFGHGVTYFKRSGSRPKEAFANLFALRNTPAWDKVGEFFPNMAKRFDEIMKENA